MTQDQQDNRREYEQGELRRAQLLSDPLQQFERWFNQALDAQLLDATAMALATADQQGRPSVRIVLLKSYSEHSYRWFTDSRSLKGQQLAGNPEASLLFYWRELERQIRISGSVAQLPEADAQSYFASRPLESRLSAAASVQSQVVEDRAALEATVTSLKDQYPDGNIPKPDEWCGYSLQAREYEFWQGRAGRLHDRFRYRLEQHNWHIERLQP